MTIEEAFGIVIRRLRRERNLSQEKLSQTSSLDRAFISKLEGGKQQPTLITIYELANALQVSVVRILMEVDQLLAFNKALPPGKDYDGMHEQLPVSFKKADPEDDSMTYNGKETILIVDDEEMLRTMLADFLGEYGYEVILAEDGVDAIEKFCEHRDRIKLVLMDVVMPRKDGFSAYKEIIRVRPDVKLLMMSGYAPDSLGTLQNCEFVQKPLSPTALAKRIRDILGAHNAG